MAELAGYAYFSRAESYYQPPGSPETWQAQVHVYEVLDNGSTVYLGVALYKASDQDSLGLRFGYPPEPDINNPAFEGYYDLDPPALRHVKLPAERVRAYRYKGNASGATLTASPAEYDLGSITVDLGTEYMVWAHWDAPDEWGSFPSPARVAFVLPQAPGLWKDMVLSEDWHRVAFGSDFAEEILNKIELVCPSPVLEMVATVEGLAQIQLTAPAARVELLGGARIELVAPAARVALTGSDASNRIELVAPAAVAALVGGAQVQLVAPSPVMSLQATVSELARIELVCPMPQVLLEATVEGLAQIALVAPAARTEFVGGARIELVAPAAVVSLEASTEGLALIHLVCPMPVVQLEAYGEATASFDLVAPAAIAGGWADIVLVAPAARALLVATAEVPVVHEAYAVNLRTQLETGGNEVTRYTAFPFSRVVRWRGRYVGMAADGLYFLGGDTDAGQPIAWHLHTGTTDFGSAQRKAWISCYVGGRMPPCSRFVLAVGEKCQERYPYDTPRGSTAQNYRQKFGRGMDARYYALELSGRGALTIDDLEAEVVNKTRRI